MNTNKLDDLTINVIELLSSAFTENMGWGEVGEYASKSLPAGFIIFLN